MIFNDFHFTAVTWLPRIALLPFLRCLILLNFHQSFTFQLIHPFQPSSGCQYPNQFCQSTHPDIGMVTLGRHLEVSTLNAWRFLPTADSAGWGGIVVAYLWWMECTKAKVKGKPRTITDGCPKVWPPLVFLFPKSTFFVVLIFFGWFPHAKVTYSISTRCWCFASGQTRYTFLHVKARKTSVGHPDLCGIGSCPILPKWPITPGFEFEINFPERPVTSSDIFWFFLFEDIPV